MITHIGQNLGLPQPEWDGDQPVPVIMYDDDETPRRLVNCLCANRRFPAWVRLENCNTSIIGTRIESAVETIDIDGEEVMVVTHVNRIYGYWNPSSGECVYFDPFFEVDV